MAPKKNNNQKKKKPELSEEDLRRLGMTEEDIQRILAERGKSSEEKKAEQAQEEEHRREQEKKAKLQRELLAQTVEIEHDEVSPRVAILEEEERAWDELEPALSAQKTRYLRDFNEKEIIRRREEAIRKREQDVQAYTERLSTLSAEERAEMVAKQEEAERLRTAALIEGEAAEKRRQERLERRRARMAEKKSDGNMFDSDSSDEDNATAKSRKAAGASKLVEEYERKFQSLLE